jgi:hypothetical protein
MKPESESANALQRMCFSCYEIVCLFKEGYELEQRQPVSDSVKAT